MNLTKEPRFTDWPKSGWRKTESLLAFANNPRTHTTAQVKQIIRSIEEFGFTNPILVDDSDTIIAGHGRCEAARQLKIKQVPVIVLTGLTDDQLRAYVMADNQLAQNAGWDEGLLALELGALNDAGFDLPVIGFPDDVLANFLDEPDAGLTDPDDVPEAPEKPVSKLGDVWLLGEHRVMCGDATEADNVATLLNGAKPFIMVTDPPYGVEFDPAWRKDLPRGVKRDKYIFDDTKADWTEVLELVEPAVVYMWCASWFVPEVGVGLTAHNYERRNLLIWRKQSISMSRGHYQWQHEPCWYAVKKGSTAKWTGDRKQSTIWDISNNILESEIKTKHAAQKPVECMERPLRNHGGKGDSVVDLFLGSGSTLIAAERVGRQCFAMELLPSFVDIAVLRWQEFTGKSAILEASGQEFDEVQSERNDDTA